MLDYKELPENGVLFEQFIRELLLKTGLKVHWTGVGPDGGRDLVAIETATGQLGKFSRRWLVSCKHKAHGGASVGMDALSSITDDCKAVDATGFLLACSTQPSSGVVRRLEELSSSGNLTTTFWDGVELERRLDTPETFPLIHKFFPESAKANPWRIYNTTAPSRWAANFRGYFFYLSSRTAHTFPTLTDVAAIIERMETVTLPAKHGWNSHLLRPRSIYFDNKHETFSVALDYIFPSEREFEALASDDILAQLKDGDCLHSDGVAGWMPTFWQLRRRSALQMSDHFHEDHADYYDSLD